MAMTSSSDKGTTKPVAPRTSGAFASLRTAVAFLRDSPTAANSTWAAFGEGGRIVTQATLLLLLARELHPAAFGRFVGCLALLQLLGPFLWCGAYNLVVQRHAMQGISPAEAVAKSATTVVVTGVLGSILLGPLIHVVLVPTVPLSAVMALTVGELVFAGLTETFAAVGLAIQALVHSAAIRWIDGVSGLVAFGGYVFVAHRSSEVAWYFWYAALAAGSPLVTYFLVRSAAGVRLVVRFPTAADLRQGLAYSIGGTSYMIQDNIDKPMLLAFSTAAATGMYTAAYRVVTVFLMPFRALLMATYAKFFRIGSSGLGASAAYAKRLSVPALAYALLAAVTMFFSAPLFAAAFGPGYSQMATAIRWLAFLPITRVLGAFIGDALTGANLNTVRVRVMVTAAGINVGLNFIFIPLWSWRGAVMTTAIAEVVLFMSLWIVVYRRLRQETTEMLEVGPNGDD